MGRKVDLDDLVDANAAAELLGLVHRNTVSVYQHRYKDMPQPALDLGDGRVKLWLGSELQAWATKVAAEGRTRRRRTSTAERGEAAKPDQRPSGSSRGTCRRRTGIRARASSASL